MCGSDDGGQETAVAADLVERATVGKSENQCTSAATVEQSKAVLSFEDIEEGPDFAVDDHGIAEEFGVPDRWDIGRSEWVCVIGPGITIEVFSGGGVEEAAVGIEAAVLDSEWNFECTAWEIETGFDFIADQVEAGESGVDIQPCGAHGVVMVPERGGGLIVVVDVIAAAAGDVPVFREAVVFGAGVTAVQVCDGADFGVGGVEHVVPGSIECGVDGQQMFCGQCICEANANRDAASRFNGGSGVAAVVAPDCGQWQTAVQAGLELGHGDGGGDF